MKCNKCNADLPDSAKFCFSCGTKVNLKKICGKCGAEMPPDAKFCSSCGNSLAEQEKKAQNNPKKAPKEKRNMYMECTLFGENFKFPSEEYAMRRYVQFVSSNIASSLIKGFHNLDDFIDGCPMAIEYEYTKYLRQFIPILNKQGIQMNEMELLNSVLGDLYGAREFFSYLSASYTAIVGRRIKRDVFPSFNPSRIGRPDSETKNIINTMVKYKKANFGDHIVHKPYEFTNIIIEQVTNISIEESIESKANSLYDAAKHHIYEYVHNDILFLTLYIWIKYLHPDYTRYVYTIDNIKKSNAVAANWNGNYKKMPRQQLVYIMQYTSMGEEKWVKEIATAMSDEDTENLKKFLVLLHYDDIAKSLSGENFFAKMYGGKFQLERIEKRMGTANNEYYQYIKAYAGKKPLDQLCAMMFNAARDLKVRSNDQQKTYKKFLEFGEKKAKEVITPTSLDKYGQVLGDPLFNEFWKKLSPRIAGIEKGEKPIFIYIDTSLKFFIVTTYAIYINNQRFVIRGLDDPDCRIDSRKRKIMDDYDNLITFCIGNSEVEIEMNDGDYIAVRCIESILSVIMFLVPWYQGKGQTIDVEAEPINNPFYMEVLNKTGARKIGKTRSLLYELGKKLASFAGGWHTALDDMSLRSSSMKKGEFAINRMNPNKRYGEDEKPLFLLGDLGIISSKLWVVVSNKAIYLNENNKIYPFNIVKEFGYKIINDKKTGLYINGEIIGEDRIDEETVKALNLYIQAMVYIYCGKRIDSFI